MKNMDKGNIGIFSTTSGKKIAKGLSKKLDLEFCDTDVKKFSDGEISVNISGNVYSKVFLIASIFPNPHCQLIELFFLIDALKRSGVEFIKLFIPYFVYARQDKILKNGESLSAKTIANLMESTGINEVVIFDVHNLSIVGFFNICAYNMNSALFFSDFIMNELRFNADDFVLVAPDHGAISRVRMLAKCLKTLDIDNIIDSSEIVVIDKFRKRANVSEVMNISGDVAGRNVIIYDDIVDTAGTIIKAALALKKKSVDKIYVCASHAILSGSAINNINESEIEKFIFLNTIDIDYKKKSDKIEVLNIEDKIVLDMLF